MKHTGNENKGNDHQYDMHFTQILLTDNIRKYMMVSSKNIRADIAVIKLSLCDFCKMKSANCNDIPWLGHFLVTKARLSAKLF